MNESKLNETSQNIRRAPDPWGMAISRGSTADHRILVADLAPVTDDSRILSVNPMTARTTILATWGQAPGQVIWPRDIAVDRNTGNIFVADNGNQRIQKFSPTFTFLKEWPVGKSEDFNAVPGIAIDSKGDIYVTHFVRPTQEQPDGVNRVVKFDHNGVFIKAWGQTGTGDGEFHQPGCIAVQSNDDIVVTNGRHIHNIFNVQKFKSDGQFIKRWGQKGTGDGEFQGPEGIAVDPNDNIYVVDSQNHRVQKFNPNGVFIKKWPINTEFGDPRCITYNPFTTKLLVSDKNGIQIFTTDGVFSGKVNFGPIASEP